MTKFKKFISTLIGTVMLTITVALPVAAKNGDIMGYAKYSDIAAYINHYPITSYNINGYTAVVAEDLQNYGFNVEWNGTNRTLNVVQSGRRTITPYGTVYKYSKKAGQNSFPYLESDITTYVNGQKVDSFNIGGKTCIYLETLKPYGEVVWVPEVRAIKMWINDLPVKDYEPLAEAPETLQTNTTQNQNVSTSNTTANDNGLYNPNICGTVSGTITYFYNNFKGNVGDTGATIMLIPKYRDTKQYSHKGAALRIPGKNESGIVVIKADGNGNYTFNNVPVGEYKLIVVSNKTTDRFYYEDKETAKQLLRSVVEKYFNKEDTETFVQFAAINKWTTEDVKVTENNNYVFSYDFGITYI